MRALDHGLVATSISPHQEIHQALRALPHTHYGRHLYAYASVARVNPYQSLLYHAFPEKGFAVTPFHTPIRPKELLFWKDQVDSVTLHLHWTGFVTNGARSEEHARTLSQGYLGRLQAFKEQGGNIVWTTHNVYPHNARYVNVELELQQGLADLADAIHVMASATTAALEKYTSLDGSKVLIAPHPNYSGAYEDHVTRFEARSRLGIDYDEHVIVLFGALKEYKGLNRLYRAFRIANEVSAKPLRLLIAGAPDDSPSVQQFVEHCRLNTNVLIDDRRIPGNLAQLYLRAADLGVVTYDRSLNSGAALLYLTFGLPVVATDTPVLRESLPTEVTTFIAQSVSDEEFAQSLLEALDRFSDIQAPASEFVKHLDPAAISEKFASDLRAHLGL